MVFVAYILLSTVKYEVGPCWRKSLKHKGVLSDALIPSQSCGFGRGSDVMKCASIRIVQVIYLSWDARGEELWSRFQWFNIHGDDLREEKSPASSSRASLHSLHSHAMSEAFRRTMSERKFYHFYASYSFSSRRCGNTRYFNFMLNAEQLIKWGIFI